MTKLEEKLKELGYTPDLFGFYTKKDINILIHENKIYKDHCYVIVGQKNIRNKNDIQELKDSIDYYHEQLMIMQKDLEELKNAL